MQSQKWNISSPNPTLVENYSKELGVSPLISQILLNRGISDITEARNFLNPRLNTLSSPLDIPNMTMAIKRVLSAKENHEKILIYGDYDADGVTGTAILVHAMRQLGIAVSYYVPHRYDEGYGLNFEALQKAYLDKVNLIITVDCGISNKLEIDLAASLGMDVIVTDHHTPPRELPAAYAVVNPKLIEGSHPSKHLSGAGVAFKFVWALLRFVNADESLIKEFLDLAALGTVADIVPLLQENRTLTVHGLKDINARRRVGIKGLIDAAGLTEEISTRHISFMLAPRLNAAGRLEHANLSIELLLSDEEDKAGQIAQELNRINTRRQNIGSSISEQVFNLISDKKLEENKVLVISGENWHPGVIGIVASQVVDRYNRPAILIGSEGDFGRGSARSIEGINIYEILSSCRDLYNDFGGHRGAAGFEIDPKKIPEFTERICSLANQSISPETLLSTLEIDAELSLPQINTALMDEISHLEPFGMGNPAPLFQSSGLTFVNPRTVGKTNSHLKAKLTDGKTMLEAVGFDLGHLCDQVSNGLFDVVYNLELNEWDGYRAPQLKIVDIKKQ